ncbi:MAG: CBS domain-containing protein [Thermomicrobiales bacterium]
MTEPTVADLMQRDVPIASPSDSVGTVARMLAESGLPGVPIVEDGAIVGIVTESDIIAREAAVDVPAFVPFLDAIFVADAGRDFDEELRKVVAVTAGELMTSPVYNIKSTATLEQVATLMINERVNPVPVVDEELQLVGIVSRADLVRVIARLEAID